MVYPDTYTLYIAGSVSALRLLVSMKLIGTYNLIDIKPQYIHDNVQKEWDCTDSWATFPAVH